MSIGPEAGFSTLASTVIDEALKGIDRRADKLERQAAERAVYDLAIAGGDLAQCASDLLYLLENEPDDSSRLDRAILALRRAMNDPKQLVRPPAVFTAAA